MTDCQFGYETSITTPKIKLDSDKLIIQAYLIIMANHN